MKKIVARLRAAAGFLLARVKEPSTYAGLGAAVAGAPPFPYQAPIIALCGVAAFLVREGHKAPAGQETAK